MQNDPNQAARNLAELLDRQLVIYGEVLDLSQQQAQAIANRDAEDLMQLLTEKQKRIVKIDHLTGEAAPLRDTCEQAGDQLDVDLRTMIEDKLNDLRDVLGRIVALEDEVTNAIGGERDKAGSRISQMQKGKMMHKAYGAGGKRPPPAHFKDQSG